MQPVILSHNFIMLPIIEFHFLVGLKNKIKMQKNFWKSLNLLICFKIY